MQHSEFQIPNEFSSQLRYVESHDKRSNEEILKSLQTHVPIASEKNIWAFWHSGVGSMPNWCQRNVVNWIRLNGPSWTVRILDNLTESPNYALKWVDEEMVPEAFVQGTMDGPYIGPHSADFLRGACIYRYGGVWMDTGIILMRKIDNICWEQLEDVKSPFQVSVPWMYGAVMANHFIAGRKGDPFIKRWHEIFMYLWKGHTNPDGIVENNPILAFVKDFKFEDAGNFHWDFIVGPVMVANYISQVFAWLRLCMLEDPTDGFDGPDYCANKILWFNSLTEDWAAEDTVGFVGQDLFDALATKRDADSQSEQYQKAYRMTWRLITSASMQKITHGKNLTLTPALGILWDEKENEGKDIEPGTFAELLRHASVHFEQTRETIDYVKGAVPEQRIREPLLGPG